VIETPSREVTCRICHPKCKVRFGTPVVQTATDDSRQALEHSQQAYEQSGQANLRAVNEHGIAVFGHEDIAILAHALWGS